jgi:hypothetical protein
MITTVKQARYIMRTRDFNFDDLVESALNTIIEDCKDFQDSNQADLEGENLEQCGTDFYFTRNGHGAGFWDGDYEHARKANVLRRTRNHTASRRFMSAMIRKSILVKSLYTALYAPGGQ